MVMFTEKDLQIYASVLFTYFIAVINYLWKLQRKDLFGFIVSKGSSHAHLGHVLDQNIAIAVECDRRQPLI